MVDSIKQVPLYNNIYNVVNTVVSGYLETKYFAFGPYSRIYSFNKIEGNRVQIGGRTTPGVSRKFRLSGFLAYGFKDKKFKGGGSLEWMLSRHPTMKLTFSGKKDMMQLGKGTSAFNETSLLTSILTKRGSEKRSLVNEYATRFDWEIKKLLTPSNALDLKMISSKGFVQIKGEV